ncbi:MAG: glycosyltransferase [Spirochaetales bacterium]|jgi:glycosyltransferase involved in cell wall biosynthesis|nr:glycosyltransferase [Spirochaetales bacterium]
MRIAFFVEIFYPEINGVLTATLDLARNLKNRGHHVLLVAPKAKESEAVREIDGMEVFKVPSVSAYMYPGLRGNNPWSRAVRRKMREDKIDIVHTTGPGTMCYAAISCARKYGMSVVQTFHTLLNEDTYLLYLVRFKRLLPLGRFIAWRYMGMFIRGSDLITAPSRFVCDELEKRYPQKTVRHISNGIDFSLFKDFPSEEEFARRYPCYNKKTFVFVGRVGLEKSIDVLIRSFASAAKTGPELRLVIVGDGPSRAAMTSLASEMGAAGNIVFLGKIPHADLLKSGVLQYARAFVTASVTENQPMTVIEASCCALPLVVADTPGMREIVSGNALLFPPGDEAALTRAILDLAADEALCGQLRSASRAISSRFDGMNVARQFEDEYRKLLEEKSSAK